ncbi:MAG: hypothetical protein K8R38_06650 [Verrucomicrobia bacterium]|nr:hypothetical protein [Verrucomicrobiota bacterium]
MFHPPSNPKTLGRLLLLALLFCAQGILLAEESSESSGAAQGGQDGGAPSDSSFQVAPPSVTLPTPALPLPPPLQESTPEQQGQQEQPKPEARPRAEFNPPSAENLNLPSAQPAGNPQFAPASVGMPVTKLDETTPGAQGAGPGPLGGAFDWAKKLRFQVAVRGGYDSNVNSSQKNAVASTFGNLNGGINYRFGTSRMNMNASLTGGFTQYSNAGANQSQQGTIGLGMATEFRFSPRLVLTYNTSTSYQQQPNPSLIGTSQNQNGSYIYTANSFAAAYQWSELFTTVTRLNFTGNYYLESSLNTQQGFTQPGFGQSFRWLVRPTTTAVVDYSTDNYGYAQQGNNSWGQTLSGGFDHTFNPKLFWNFRGGAEFRTYQNTNQDGTYIGPYLDNNFSWAFGRASSLSWIAHVGTQPSGQQNVSFSPAVRTGVSYRQGLAPKLNLNSGFFYLIQNYKDSSFGPNGTLINYSQSTVQGNIDLTYDLNRILQLALGYQYLASMCPSVPAQEYNRGISYLQIKGAF